MKPTIIFSPKKADFAYLVDLDSVIQFGEKSAFNLAIELRDRHAGSILFEKEGGRVVAPRILLVLDGPKLTNLKYKPIDSRGFDRDDPAPAEVMLRQAALMRNSSVEMRGGVVSAKVDPSGETFNYPLFLAAWCWPEWQRKSQPMKERWERMRSFGYSSGEKACAEHFRRHGLKFRRPKGEVKKSGWSEGADS